MVAVCRNSAAKENGQLMVPSDASVSPAPGPSPATIPLLLSPDVNATWHMVDSPPNATCEVGPLSPDNMPYLPRKFGPPVTDEGIVFGATAQTMSTF